MLEDAIRHRVDELVQHIHPYKQGGVASPSPTLLASLPLLPVQREASPASQLSYTVCTTAHNNQSINLYFDLDF